jgi:hypothetical protein
MLVVASGEEQAWNSTLCKASGNTGYFWRWALKCSLYSLFLFINLKQKTVCLQSTISALAALASLGASAGAHYIVKTQKRQTGQTSGF